MNRARFSKITSRRKCSHERNKLYWHEQNQHAVLIAIGSIQPFKTNLVRMNTALCILGIVALLSGCASLTKTQVESVNQFAQTTKDFSTYPSKIMFELAEIRAKRGIYYANTLTDPKLHMGELDGIYDHKKFDCQVAANVDVTFKIIDKYSQSLLLLSSDKYVADLENQKKTFGEDIDTLIGLNNSIKGAIKIPAGIGGAVSELIVMGGKQYVKTKQAKEIKKFVTLADTLISVMTFNLLQYLQSANIKELIESEERGISESYLSYLRQIKTETRTRTISSNKKDTIESIAISYTKATLENERDYLDLKNRIDGIKTMQQQTIEATKALRATHKKMLEIIKKKRDLKQVIKELQELYEQIIGLKETIRKIETNK